MRIQSGLPTKQFFKMSSVSTSRPKPANILDKKVPVNPKYEHVKPTVDTGSSVTKYMAKIEDIRKNYKFKKDEIFKRMKVSTFVQLIVGVWELNNTNCNSSMNNGTISTRPDTADREVQRIEAGQHRISPAPSLALTEGDYGAPDQSGKRSTLQGVIRGVGEMEIDKPAPSVKSIMDDALEECPYLLLDVRLDDEYDECHILTAKRFPKALLSRAQNYETKDMLQYKNKDGKIIVVYDEDEKVAPEVATTLCQRGYDNVFMLSGGMRIAYKVFPEGLFTGTPTQNVTESTRPRPKNAPMATSQTDFTQHDIDRLNIYINNVLSDKSSGSRLSNASTAASSSRMGGTKSSISQKSYMAGSVTTARPAFR